MVGPVVHGQRPIVEAVQQPQGDQRLNERRRLVIIDVRDQRNVIDRHATQDAVRVVACSVTPQRYKPEHGVGAELLPEATQFRMS